MLYIYLFGHVRVFHGKHPVALNMRPRTLALWASLLLGRHEPIPRDSLAFRLWPDETESAARADLRRHLHELEHALPASSDEQPWVLRQGATIQWNPQSAHWLDVAEFERLSALSDYLDKAASLYTADLLIDLYDDWLEDERARLRSSCLNVLHQLMIRQRDLGDLEAARSYAEAALRHDPLDEPLTRDLMRLQYQAGDRAGALKTFDAFQLRLSDDLGADPSQETLALHELIVAEQPPPAISPVKDALRESKHNLPAALTSFFGRDEELVSLNQMLAQTPSPVRLITLIGPPGVGKTRLALEAGRRLLDRQSSTFPDGIFFVDLSTLTEPVQVLSSVAAALGVRESTDQPLADRLRDHLKAQYVLLILDNFEQVLPAATEITDLLAAAPALRVLATSREPLKLYGEQEFALAPLPYPDLNNVPEPAAMIDYAAVALFDARSRQRQRQFALTTANAADVAGICFHLDGLPLAVELAAGQMRDLTVSDILAQLQQKRIALASDYRGLPQRHQTLQAAIEWSYDLLGESEKRLFRQLAVFSGSWTPDAAEAVCDAFDGGTMLDGLTLLAEKNLIKRLSEGEQARWRMLATIHEFALVRLKALPDAVPLHVRHAQYFSDHAAAIRKELDGPRAQELLGLLRLEDDNVHAALTWSLIEAPHLNATNLKIDSINAGAVLAVSMNRHWARAGRIQEGLKWYREALRYQAMLPLPIRSELFNMTGFFNELIADYSQAEAYYLEALALAQRLEDANLIGRTLLNLGICASKLTDFQKAHKYYSESITFAREAAGEDMSPLLFWGLHNLALVEKNLGNISLSRSLMEEVLVHARKTGDPHRIAGALGHLGGLANLEGDYERARRYNMDSLSVHHSIEDKIGICATIYGIAEAWRGLGQFEVSARLFGIAHALQEKMGLSYSAAEESELNREHNLLSQRLGDENLNQLMAEGAAMTLNEAVAYALQPA